MMQKPHTKIKSVSPALVEVAVEKIGAPHNFVESAEATFASLPSLDSDPRATRVIDNLETVCHQYVRQSMGEHVEIDFSTQPKESPLKDW